MAGIGVNLRVTGHCNQGGRRYMEDMISIAYQQTDDLKDLEYAYFGIFDGHGGAEAAAYVKDNLLDNISSNKSFWSDDDDAILQAIRDGYLTTHYNMWKRVESWPKTSTGLPSTSGTTATIAFIMRGKIYIGHVGDSCVVLGSQEGDGKWRATPLTRDHKPENEDEMKRISSCGGKVVKKSGVPRVVWNRPQLGHQGPVRRSTTIDEIPFLAVARSLGDFWSYNSKVDKFVVSPEPDVGVFPVDVNKHKCLIFGTDGLWNMLSPDTAIQAVQQAESNNENHLVYDAHNSTDSSTKVWLNPSKCLVDYALERWRTTKLRADNTSVVTLMLDPPGPPRSQVLLSNPNTVYSDENSSILMNNSVDEMEEIPRSGGLAIYTQYPPISLKNIENDLNNERHPTVSAGLPATNVRVSGRNSSVDEDVKNRVEDKSDCSKGDPDLNNAHHPMPVSPDTIMKLKRSKRSIEHRYSSANSSFSSDEYGTPTHLNTEEDMKKNSKDAFDMLLADKGVEPSEYPVYHYTPVSSECIMKRRKRSEDSPATDENISDVENESTPQWKNEPKKRRLSSDKKKCNKPSWQQPQGKLSSGSSYKSRRVADHGSLMKMKIRRTLRSNSAPADSQETWVKTLRSRNVDLRTTVGKRDSV